MSGIVKRVNCTWICFILPLCVCLPSCMSLERRTKCTVYASIISTGPHVFMCVIINHTQFIFSDITPGVICIVHINFNVAFVCMVLPFLCSAVRRGKPSSARAVRWCHPRSCSAAAGWSSCAETACWSSINLSQSPVAPWLDSALNGTTPGEKDTQTFDVSPLSSPFF